MGIGFPDMLEPAEASASRTRSGSFSPRYLRSGGTWSHRFKLSIASRPSSMVCGTGFGWPRKAANACASSRGQAGRL